KETKDPEEPKPKRYKTEDPTIEKLAELLIDNPRGLLVHRDELSGWLRSLDKQGREADRAFYLESWNGTGSFEIDRIARGSLYVPALCVSILGGIQPGPLRSYVYEAARGGEGADGLLQRFQLLVWPDPPSGPWRNVDRRPDAEAKERAFRVYEKLDALSLEGTGAADDGEGGVPALRFTLDAQEVFDEWRGELEGRLRGGELSPHLESHLAKYRSLMPSLALVFYLVSVVDGAAKAAGGVGAEAALRATAWCEYLETHAKRLYASAEDAALEGARVLLGRIRKGDVRDGAAVREVYRGHEWSRLSTPEEVNAAVSVLEEHGWLRVEKVPTKGRPTLKLRLHPVLLGGKGDEK
nr:YfjI family protein [Actinomycetota bacterium]